MSVHTNGRMSMEIKVVSEKHNPLLKRREVLFEIDHKQTGGTPRRFEVRKALAKLLNVELDLVYVKKFSTKTGTMSAVGTANVYQSAEQAKLVEPKYIILRNAPPEKPEEKKAEEGG